MDRHKCLTLPRSRAPGNYWLCSRWILAMADGITGLTCGVVYVPITETGTNPILHLHLAKPASHCAVSGSCLWSLPTWLQYRHHACIIQCCSSHRHHLPVWATVWRWANLSILFTVLSDLSQVFLQWSFQWRHCLTEVTKLFYRKLFFISWESVISSDWTSSILWI